MNPVDKVNKLSKSDFISTFGNVFEKTTWIAEKVFNFKPFGNFENLSEKFLIIFENENEKNCLKIFNAHPELAIKKIMTTDSRKEQKFEHSFEKAKYNFTRIKYRKSIFLRRISL